MGKDTNFVHSMPVDLNIPAIFIAKDEYKVAAIIECLNLFISSDMKVKFKKIGSQEKSGKKLDVYAIYISKEELKIAEFDFALNVRNVAYTYIK